MSKTTTPTKELDNAKLVEEWKKVRESIDWYGSYEEQQEKWDRSAELWREIVSRSDEFPPECPGCGGRRWGQSAGDPVYCVECGREVADPELEEDVHDAWSLMVEDVYPGASEE